MTEEQISQIKNMREENYPYSFIAKTLGLSINTVKSLCRRNDYKPICKKKTKEEMAAARFCKYCHNPLKSTAKESAEFCSSRCRVRWHRENMKITKMSSEESKKGA